MPEPLTLTRRAITHPDAALLVEQVQEEYVVRYGSRDDSPLDGTEFDDANGLFFVGYDGDRPVATGGWRWRPVPDGAPGTRAVEIKRMYVASSHRGRGLGRVVLAHLERTADEAGADVIALETGLRQPEAIALYEATGYLPIAGFGHYKDAPLSRCFAKTLVEGGRFSRPAPR